MNSATLVRLGAISMSMLTALAALPSELGEVSTIIPAEWKPIIVKVGLISALILHVVHLVMAPPATSSDKK